MSALQVVEPIEPGKHGPRRGGDHRGSSTSRRRQREWLVQTYRADVDLIDVEIAGRVMRLELDVRDGLGEMYGEAARMCCRCYRCGCLLTVDEVTRDRITPGVEGGRYVRANLRPACGRDNSSTGGSLGAARRAATR